MSAPKHPLLPGSRRRPVGLGLAALLVAVAVYWGVLPVFLQHIDDDPVPELPQAPAGGSAAVAAAAGLAEREVDRYGWTPNDPWIYPTAALDNMPNFQLGMMAALARFAVEMGDQMARSRGSSLADPDLEKAAGFLRFPGTVWVWNPSVSLLPQTPAEDQYRAAILALRRYNQRLADQTAVFDRRADNLQMTLDRIAADLGSASAGLENAIVARGWTPIDFTADDVFYQTKGRLYAYSIVLQALGTDFATVIREREVTATWTALLESLAEAAALRPLIILNGAPDGLIGPSHLAAQGFFLLRARTQLREITQILQK